MAADLRSADADAFRGLFAHHAGGVVIITFDSGGGPSGFTATSLTSVSLDPPLVTFAVSRTASCWPHLRDARTVVVNFLGHDQEDLARRFASRGVDRFAEPLDWYRAPTGEPVLGRARRRLRGAIRQRNPVGDHEMVVVEILEIGLDEDDARSSLVYHSGTYHAVGDLR